MLFVFLLTFWSWWEIFFSHAYGKPTGKSLTKSASPSAAQHDLPAGAQLLVTAQLQPRSLSQGARKHAEAEVPDKVTWEDSVYRLSHRRWALVAL